ncbi:MAG: NifU family protein [Patescibacteria group bacterium]|nr:NifU family protein [Patescibacteria group bacterium]MDD5294453.1 NifU family protein [Patescibacteria group bacterium]MDD5554991.1 NifU family protein [Patescibacteria group bacterium]
MAKKQVKNNIEDKIKKSIERVRPSLQADGGDIEFIGWYPETGIVQVSLVGHCAHCPMSQMTLKQGIEAEIKKAVPEVKEVINA